MYLETLVIGSSPMQRFKILRLQNTPSCFSGVWLARQGTDSSQNSSLRRWLWCCLSVLVLSCGFGDGMLLGQTGEAPQGKQGSRGKSDAGLKETKGETEAAAATGKNEPNKTASTASKDLAKSKDVVRLREGHRFENLTAMIQITETERFLATIEGDKNFLVLENLALERIAEAMRVDSTDNRWVLTGRVTEFRGQNYVWVERATRAAKIAGQ
jgi:hypothetical protein